jgi:glycosyltransferase involved in cell wall biosynthesis
MNDLRGAADAGAGASRPATSDAIDVAATRQPVARSEVLKLLRRFGRAAYWLATLQIGARLRERREVRTIHASGLFDLRYYGAHSPDIAAAGRDPVLHYVAFGAAEGRNPSADFDTATYVEERPEAAGNPLVHYIENGHRRGIPAPRPLGPQAALLPPEMQAALRAATRAARQAAAGFAPDLPRFAPVPHPRASLLVTIGDDPARLARALQALAEHGDSVPFEVVLVGRPNPSLEQSLQGTGIVWVEAGNAPCCAWPNLAARVARGDYLVLLSDDVLVLPHWLAALLESFERFPDTGAVGAYLLHGNGQECRAGGVIQADGRFTLQGKYRPIGHHDFASVRAVDFVPLSGLAIPAEIWRSLQGIDERFATQDYGAADLALRIRTAGYAVRPQPFARVVLVEGWQDPDVRQRRADLALMRRRWGAQLRGAEPIGRSEMRPKALFIDAMPPTPDRDAGSAVVDGFLRMFQARGYEITFVAARSLAHAGRYTDELRRRGIIYVSAPFIDSIESFLAESASSFDLVLLWRAPIAEQVLGLVRRLAPRAKIVFHTQDLHYLREERQAELSGSQSLRAEAARTRRAELAAIRAADCTILVSRHEVELLAAVGPEAKTCLIPLFHDLPGLTAPWGQRRGVVFIGGFLHRPNVDAVGFLASEIWPLVRKALPKAELCVVGGDAPEEIRRLDDPAKGVRILGWVEDLAEILRFCRLTVAPLRFGAGTKGKIVTSLAHGVPCVATPLAIEGTGLEPGRHIMVGDQPAALAAAIVEVYGNEGLWNALSAAGLDFARSAYSFEGAAARLEEMLKDLALPHREVEQVRLRPTAIRPAPPDTAAPPPTLTVSVVVPLYNHARYIADTLSSLLAQTRPAQEIIVIDDGSTDRSAEIAAQFSKQHPEILFFAQENRGAHAAINAGIGQAKGDLIAILNSDDLYSPDRLEVMVDEFGAEPSLDAVVTTLGFIDEAGAPIANPWYDEGVLFHHSTRDPALSLINANIFMTTSNLLARRGLFSEVGGFSPLRYTHDLDFFLRLIVKGKRLRMIDEPLLLYRQHANNTIREGTFKVKAETAAATAFFLHTLWDRGVPIDWKRAADFTRLLERHTMAAAVLLCLAYFRRHPSDTLESSPFHGDEVFRRQLDTIIR